MAHDVQDPKTSIHKSDVPFFAKIAVVMFFSVFVILFILKFNSYNPYSYTSLELITAQPRSAQGYHLRAKSLIAQGRYDEAEQAAKQSLQITPTFYRSLIDLGCVCMSRGDYLKAKEYFLAALRYIGDSTFDYEVIYTDLGIVYEKERNTQDSWDYYRKAFMSLNHMGNSVWDDQDNVVLKYVRENSKEKFIEYIGHQIGIPSELWTREKNVKDLLFNDNYRVIAECRRYLDDNPRSHYEYIFRALLVTAYLDERKLQDAMQELMILERMDLPLSYKPWLLDSFAHLAYYKNDGQTAKRYLTEVVKNYPDYESIDQAKSLLEELKSLGQ